ncbi:NAD(P)-dependent alcohol dehydrogenase [uncultured Cohaesibacter sp.]|uniref:NAD(P)-dependent alcohol dehydrogenase n=1 Tax=uncultured Cohaesibacter sp. TaxID=1002546 RepID=UPI00292F0943|nr:NAD(P)-dependent alcohol dehydrogenase [uncultured Cohaesibacter sp.]
MCQHCDDQSSDLSHKISRRTLIGGGASLVAASSLSGSMLGMAGSALAAGESQSVAAPEIKAHGWGMMAPGEKLRPFDYVHRSMRPDDIVVDIMYAGICHSDIHFGHGDWRKFDYLLVPGHEIVGRVTHVGPSVSRFRVGDIAGVGCMVDSCGECEYCRAGLEQYCVKSPTLTYGRNRDRSLTYGGYADRIVLNERFGIKIPQGMDLRSAAPIMCAGITTFSPQQYYNIQEGQRVGVIGLGGLGHMALKLLTARGAEVTVFTTTEAKRTDALRMGARDVMVWSEASNRKDFKPYYRQFDYIISTVPYQFNVNMFIPLLRFEGTLINVGVIGDMGTVNGGLLVDGRKTLTGTMIGGIPETQEVVNYCAERNIRPEVEMISIDQLNEAWDQVVAKKARYRFVIDMT